jgi:N-acyl homoserine lactone hydrolase
MRFGFATVSGLLLLSAHAALAASAASPAIELYALNCGHIRIADAEYYADDGSLKGQVRELIDPCYLIRHPKGDLIWDTGLGDAVHDKPVDSDGERLEVPVKLVDQLKLLSLTSADIEFFSISHSHFDHVGNAALFTRATWIVDPDERAHMFRPAARADEDFKAIAPLEKFKTVSIAGDGDYDVFGDGSVTIVQAPGHTPGHCVLLVRLAKAGAVLLTGDLWHLAESRKLRTVPRFNSDRAQTLKSMDKVEALAASTGARVVRQHVPEDFSALPRFPEPLR